jgi:hypothetical protein
MAMSFPSFMFLDKLIGTNYTNWKVRIRDIFTLRKIMNVVLGVEIRPIDITLQSDFNEKD